MPRRKSYTTAEGFQSLDQHLIAQQMIPLRVEEKQGDWNAETKTNAQKTNADGVPQWLIQTLFQPIDGDTEHAPEVVPVTVTAKVKPVIRVGGSGGICWIRRMGLRLPRQDYEAGHVGGTQLHGRRVQTERR